MKLNVKAFKSTGKYYTEETYEIKGYPSYCSYSNEQNIGYIRNEQAKFTYELWERIRSGNGEEYCPVSSGFKGFVFIFEAEFDSIYDHGFLTYMLDRTERD